MLKNDHFITSTLFGKVREFFLKFLKFIKFYEELNTNNNRFIKNKLTLKTPPGASPTLPGFKSSVKRLTKDGVSER